VAHECASSLSTSLSSRKREEGESKLPLKLDFVNQKQR
jgi:hypothetical protein